MCKWNRSNRIQCTLLQFQNTCRCKGICLMGLVHGSQRFRRFSILFHSCMFYTRVNMPYMQLWTHHRKFVQSISISVRSGLETCQMCKLRKYSPKCMLSNNTHTFRKSKINFHNIHSYTYTNYPVVIWTSSRHHKSDNYSNPNRLHTDNYTFDTTSPARRHNTPLSKDTFHRLELLIGSS